MRAAARSPTPLTRLSSPLRETTQDSPLPSCDAEEVDVGRRGRCREAGLGMMLGAQLYVYW